MKLFSRKVKRVNPTHILVKYCTGRYQGRIQTSINFEAEYANALRSALNCIRAGYSNVEIIQYRETIHNHSELQQALSHLNHYSTDEEIIEEVHNASRPHRNNMMHLLRSSNKSNALVWANL